MEEWVMNPWFNQNVLFQINEPTDHPWSLPEDYINLTESAIGGISRNVKGGGKQAAWEGAPVSRVDGRGVVHGHPTLPRGLLQSQLPLTVLHALINSDLNAIWLYFFFDHARGGRHQGEMHQLAL